MANCKACGAWFGTATPQDLCPTCERALKRLNGYAVPVVRCGECEKRDKELNPPPPPTNADRIRAMSVEELAEFICEIAYGRKTPWSEPFVKKFCDRCPTVRGTYASGKEDDFHECDFVDGECPNGSDTVWWLRQPAEEEST